LHRFVGP